MKKLLFRMILSLLAGILLILLFLKFIEFKPPSRTTPEIKGSGKPLDPSARTFSFLTWNIGYAGLGQESDFFFDGGRTVIPAQPMCARWYDGILQTIRSNDTLDFILLQEVDTDSKRSWNINQVAGISSLMTGFSSVFAMNYQSPFLPVPVTKPLGKVNSGIMALCRYRPEQAAVRYFDEYFYWPKRIAFPKRCFMTLRYRLDNGKELVVINTHNSAFDLTGKLRRREMEMLDSAATAEYRRGNWVVVGGDWNNNPPEFNATTIVSGDLALRVERQVEDGYFHGWQHVFDPSFPTNRYLDIPYVKGKTRTTVIDFFVVSPNVEVKKVETLHDGFRFSDHNPVRTVVGLK